MEEIQARGDGRAGSTMLGLGGFVLLAVWELEEDLEFCLKWQSGRYARESAADSVAKRVLARGGVTVTPARQG